MAYVSRRRITGLYRALSNHSLDIVLPTSWSKSLSPQCVVYASVSTILQYCGYRAMTYWQYDSNTNCYCYTSACLTFVTSASARYGSLALAPVSGGQTKPCCGRTPGSPSLTPPLSTCLVSLNNHPIAEPHHPSSDGYPWPRPVLRDRNCPLSGEELLHQRSGTHRHDQEWRYKRPDGQLELLHLHADRYQELHLVDVR